MTLAVLVLISVALVFALLLARGFFLGYPAPPFRSKVLSAKEQAIVAACADTFFPARGPISLSGTQAGLVAYMDRHVGDLAPDKRALVKLLFHFIEHGPWIFGPRRARFTRLAHGDRLDVLKDMSRSSIYFRRIAFLSIRTMLTMGYLANADVAREMGIGSDEAPFPRAPARAKSTPSFAPPAHGAA